MEQSDQSQLYAPSKLSIHVPDDDDDDDDDDYDYDRDDDDVENVPE